MKRRVVALLAWFDESPQWLTECVLSCRHLSTHVVALDGAYALWEDGKASSRPREARAIWKAARAQRMGCTIHAPPNVWAGNQIEKRTALFELGETIAREGDWFLVIDADELVTSVPPDFWNRLDIAARHAGKVTLWQPAYGDGEQPTDTYNRLYRAGLGLRVEGNHGNVVAPGHALQFAEDFTDVRIEHRRERRPLKRQAAKWAYYKQLRAPDGVAP